MCKLECYTLLKVHVLNQKEGLILTVFVCKLDSYILLKVQVVVKMTVMKDTFIIFPQSSHIKHVLFLAL